MAERKMNPYSFLTFSYLTFLLLIFLSGKVSPRPFSGEWAGGEGCPDRKRGRNHSSRRRSSTRVHKRR